MALSASVTINLVVVRVKPAVSSSLTVTNRVSLTVPYSPPEALWLNVTVSDVALSSAAALTVTVWPVFQSVVVKLRVFWFPCMVLSVSTVTSLPMPLTVTVTAPLGWVVSCNV